jgi:hypothetical protein
VVEILHSWVEILICNISTKRSLNLAPFDKISKSGDGGLGGDTFLTLATSSIIQ